MSHEQDGQQGWQQAPTIESNPHNQGVEQPPQQAASQDYQQSHGFEQPPPGYEQYPQDPYAQPPGYGMSPPPKKSPKMLIAIIAIVAVVAIVAVLFLFVLGGGQATPEAAVETLVSKINSGDFNGAIETTMYHFASPADKAASANDLQGSIPATASFQVSSVTVINKDQMSQNDRDAAVELKLDFESEYGIVIEDYAKVTGAIAISNQGETGSLPIDLYAFKVGGSWYLDF